MPQDILLIPSISDLTPMAPGALTGAVLAVGSAWITNVWIRRILAVLAAIAPWWITWAITHEDGFAALSAATSSERAAASLGLFAVVAMSCPSPRDSQRTSALSTWIVPCMATFLAGCVWTLWTFLPSDHPYHISKAQLAALALLGALPVWAALTTRRIHDLGVLGVVAAFGSALGLLLAGVSGAAALSQVVASTSIAAGMTAGAAWVVSRSPSQPTSRGRGRSIEPGIIAAWLAAPALAFVDAHATGDQPLPSASTALLVLAVIAPTAFAVYWRSARRRAPEHGAHPPDHTLAHPRPPKQAMAIAFSASLLAAGAVGAAVWSLEPDNSMTELETDPYTDGSLDAYK